MRRSNVDLPQPEGPISDTNSPSRTVRSMPSSAVRADDPEPKTLSTPVISTTGRPPTAESVAPAIEGTCVMLGGSSQLGRAVAAPGQPTFTDLDQADEDQPDKRAHDDRCPQPLRGSHV